MAWYREGGWFHRSKDLVVVRSTGRVIRHTSRAVHRLLALATGLLVVASLMLAATAWRLSQGPIDLGGWSDRIRAAFADDSAPVRVSFERAYLAWEGFDKGVDHPLDLRLSDVTVAARDGQTLVTAPSAHVTFSFAGVLLGRVIPRAVEVDHARITVTRQADGGITFGGDRSGGQSPGSGAFDLKRLRERISRPVGSDHAHTEGLFDQIRRVHLRDADVSILDQPSGLLVRTSEMELDLVRARAGHIRGLLRAPLSVAAQRADLTVHMDWAAGANPMVDLKLTALRPARLGALPTLLAGIDVPITSAATITFDRDLTPSAVRAGFQIGEGQLQVWQGAVPVRSGVIALTATPARLTLEEARFDVAHSPEGAPEVVELGGVVSHEADRLRASLTVSLGRIDIADLPRLWPPGVGKDVRPWVIEHVTGGTTTHGLLSLTIDADDQFRDVALTKAEGYLDGSQGIFTWIDNIPAVERTEFQLHLVNPDILDIHLSSAHQQMRSGVAELVVKNGQMRITGLTVKDQTATINTQIEGPVASALGLLKEPRLHLLSDHPIALKIGGGDAVAKLDLQFPLKNKLEIDDIQLHADAHLTKLRLLDVAAGHNLDDGVFDLGVSKDGLTLKGKGTLAAIPIEAAGILDFRPGPAEGVVQKITVTGKPDAAQLDAAGLPVTDVMTGPVALNAVLIERRSGGGSILINGDLTPATLTVGPLAWRKPPGGSATASATLLMSQGKVTKIDKIVVQGNGLGLRGFADFVGGELRTVSASDVRVGRSAGHATIRLQPNQPISIVLQGEQIDLSAKVVEEVPVRAVPVTSNPTTPKWILDAHFKTVLLANQERAGDVVVKARCDGLNLNVLDLVGSSRTGSGFSVKIDPQAGRRHLVIDAKDAGSLMRGLDIGPEIQSGHLHVDGTLNAPFGLHPLSGSATLDDFIVKNSPVTGKLLQAISLYGLVDALSGHGMAFSRVTAPFAYDGTNLSLQQARGYNSSLGFTATGRINLATRQASIDGTIVPVYFFNSMLGKLPLIGGLFSPEKGGGLFALGFALKGKTSDLNISFNPVSVLTPGFLREMLGGP